MAKASTADKVVEVLSAFLDEDDMRSAVIGAVGRKVARGRVDSVTVAFALAKAGLTEEDARSVLDEIGRQPAASTRRAPSRRSTSTRSTGATAAAKKWWQSLDKASQTAYRSEFGAAARGRVPDDLMQKAFDSYGS